jgi:hypothetical protein
MTPARRHRHRSRVPPPHIVPSSRAARKNAWRRIWSRARCLKRGSICPGANSAEAGLAIGTCAYKLERLWEIIYLPLPVRRNGFQYDGILQTAQASYYPEHLKVCDFNSQATCDPRHLPPKGKEEKNNHLFLRRRAKIIVAISIITPPRREWLGWSARAEDGKRQNKEHSETGPIEGASNQV